MPHSSRRGLRFLVLLAVLLVGSPGCVEMDLTGLDLGSGTGCYLCYPEGPFYEPESDSVPVAVTGGLTFTEISVGTRHVCALANGGGVYCWGQRDAGTPEYRDVPYPLMTPGSDGLRRISAGESFTCGINDGGAAFCWGLNGSGQLGTGIGGPSTSSPAAVQGAFVFTTVSTTSATSQGRPHSCALSPTGEAFCWGDNYHGQLGNGGVEHASAPVAVSGGHRFASISVGANFTCGIVPDDGTYCWGAATSGQLGGNPGNAANCAPVGSGALLQCNKAPVRIAGSERFTMVSAGGSHACAVDADGRAWCWGGNFNGALGNGDYRGSYTPAAVTTALRFTTIAAGSDATCALTAVGTAFCWGTNSLGQVGDGTYHPRPLPTRVATELTFSAISVGFQGACALTPDGAAWCWGSNEGGKLGKGS